MKQTVELAVLRDNFFFQTGIKELYAASSENQRSVTVVKCIRANCAHPPAPTIIIPARRYMEN